MRRVVVCLLGGVGVLGCASRAEPTAASATPEPTPAVQPMVTEPAQTGPISPAAARIYMLGEERYTERRYPEAVALWGHAMLQLPSDSSADAVRHKLLARMGHGLLEAYKASDDPSYLEDGKSMCELYLTKHEGLFGETEAALAERGEIYELLYELEWRLENEAEVAVADEPSGNEEVPAVVAQALTATPFRTEPSHPTDSEPDSEPGIEPGTEIPEDGEDELHRLIEVRMIEWARFDDPRVIGFLRDPRDTGPSLLEVGGLVHGPRVLVRAGGLPQALLAGADAPTRKAARRVGFNVIKAARAELRRCYEVAMTRDPVMAARVEVQLTVGPDGHVKEPRLVGGSLVDAEGDACMAQALRDAMLAPPELSQPLAIAIPIQFFHEGAEHEQELFRSGAAYSSTAGADPMPPIDDFDLPAPTR